MTASTKTLVLCGGIGGAKLVAGLIKACSSSELTVIVNTADDFVHWGLNISPDLDSVMYKCSGENDAIKGWGRRDETWHLLNAMSALGECDWFQLGDKDLAVHLIRTQALKEGKTLAEVTELMFSKFGISHKILPMSNDPVATYIRSGSQDIPFQDYFVKQRCQPKVDAVVFKHIEKAAPVRGFVEALNDDTITSIIICPSNPYLSIDPIISLPGIRQRLRELSNKIPIVAISPIIANKAVKGPLAKIFIDRGLEPTVLSVAEHYGDFLNGLIIDYQDREFVDSLYSQCPGLNVDIANIMMQTELDQLTLAQCALCFSHELSLREA